MFYYLSKALPPLVYPLGLAILLLVTSLFLRRRPRWQTGLVIAAILVIWLGGNRILSMAVVRSLEWRYAPPAVMPQAEAIVLLGGGVRAPGAPRPMAELNEAGDRLTYAARLHQEGVAPHLLLSGGGVTVDGQPLYTEAETMAELLGLMGVPREALWLETASRNTYENAVESKRILEPKGIKRIVLVTSALHMPRAVAIYEKQGFEVIPAPADYQVTQADWDFSTAPNLPVQIYNLAPDANNMVMLTNAFKEYLGILIYSLQGWL